MQYNQSLKKDYDFFSFQFTCDILYIWIKLVIFIVFFLDWTKILNLRKKSCLRYEIIDVGITNVSTANGQTIEITTT